MTSGTPTYHELFNRLYSFLPLLVSWMNKMLDSHEKSAVPLDDFNYKKIKIVFPSPLRNQTKIIVVSDQIPMPPLEKIGLKELMTLDQKNAIGITYKNRMFLLEESCNEINCFHEMIHVVQWQRLGVEKFLLAYGLHLALHGYQGNPFERTAYDFQHRLESNALPMNFLETVKTQADSAWAQINPLNYLADLSDPSSI
ncbi:MAG: hypothetical protein MJE63_20935 [Proteobacteria bacterium]|nr:hypothetical protein [Pseudomonadota bacterium]